MPSVGSVHAWTSLAVAAACLLAVQGGVLEPFDDFSYEGNHGPDHWADTYKTCRGKYQSPIDIDEHHVTRVHLPPIRYEGFETPPLSSTITNNGHTVLLKLNMSEPATISGGPLKGKYVFSQLHWHWGTNDSFGSEDLINNHSYPMELHMVFYKKNYGSPEMAQLQSDGLAVMAFFYEVMPSDNAVYSEMVDYLPQIETPLTKFSLRRQLTLASLIPCARSHYFTYYGSLTTPPCLEVVTWIDFKHPIRLSHSQLETFRRLRTQHGFLTHNARPVQPLGGRNVWYNAGELNLEEDSAAPRSGASVTLVASLLAATAVAMYR
ncbi:carbonic anhydrase 7-like [Thrips palmi]|uniref:carbonic anhydrase n=1 Tax=Thrips palmi TaxID=161013 RepID=A0A6P8ZUH1_THRPL|nr:carbonic anhydrase 7-like [Thrips palmi]